MSHDKKLSILTGQGKVVLCNTTEREQGDMERQVILEDHDLAMLKDIIPDGGPPPTNKEREKWHEISRCTEDECIQEYNVLPYPAELALYN